MNKNEFLVQLRDRLLGLPKEDIHRSIDYYSEIIDDAVEEGINEEDAVSDLGSVEDIVAQILIETPLPKLVKAKAKKSRALKVWEIILLVLGSPLWLSLLIAVFAVIFSVYISLWSVIISLWAAFASLIGGSVGALALGVGYIISGNTLSGAALLCAGLVLAGLSIFLYYGCKATTKGLILLSKAFVIGIKKCFIKKEEL